MVGRNKVAVTKIAIVAIIVIAIAFGAAGLYYYTSPQIFAPGAGTSSATGSQVSTSGGASGGYQDSTGQPVGSWAKYLGYFPQGYVIAPHQANAPNFQCPPDMSSSACAIFNQSCGNGVCDPNETCATCPIDCAPTGNLVCDPYTGRPGMPASVCQAIVQQNNAGFGG